MGQTLHGRATTTIAVRKEIQESKESILKLAKRYNINPKTVIKWKKRKITSDLKPGPVPKSTVLTTEEEAIIVSFRKHTQLGLDDCLYSLIKLIPNLTRSSLHRCFQRHGISRLPQLDNNKTKKTKKFKKYEPGYVHIDISQVYTEEGKLYLFVGIDRTTKFCYAKLYKDQESKTATSFLKELIEYMPYKMHIILTDNGKQFAHTSSTYSKIHINDPLKTEKHSPFTKECISNKIEHRQTLAYHPWTNGQVERINRTIKEATIKKYYYDNHKKLQNHLNTFLNAYNYAQPLKVLRGATPYEKVLVYLSTLDDESKINPIYLSPGPNSYLSNLPV